VSCGVYGFPVSRGARIILTALRRLLGGSHSLTEVNIVSGRSIVESFHEALTATFSSDSVKRLETSPHPGDDGKCFQLKCRRVQDLYFQHAIKYKIWPDFVSSNPIKAGGKPDFE